MKQSAMTLIVTPVCLIDILIYIFNPPASLVYKYIHKIASYANKIKLNKTASYAYNLVTLKIKIEIRTLS